MGGGGPAKPFKKAVGAVKSAVKDPLNVKSIATLATAPVGGVLEGQAVKGTLDNMMKFPEVPGLEGGGIGGGNVTDKNVSDALAQDEQIQDMLRRRQGRASTILTGSTGLQSAPGLARKTLLGY